MSVSPIARWRSLPEVIENISNLYYTANNPSEATIAKLRSYAETISYFTPYRRLMEIESRLLPCSLHVVGKPPTAEEAVATLVNIASLDRQEEGLKGLPLFIKEGIPEAINIQPQDGKAKSYQVAQIRAILIKHQ